MQHIYRQIVQFEWFLLILVAPLFLFPRPALVFALLILPLLWLVRQKAEGRFVPATPLNVAFLLLLVSIGISLYATDDVRYSLPKVAGLLYGVAVFYATVAVTERPFPWLWRGVAALLLAGAGLTILSLAGTNWSEKVQGVQWLTSRLPPPIFTLPGAADGFHPNQVAGTLLWVTPVALVVTAVWLKRFTRYPLQGMANLAGLFLFLLVLLLTQSRGAWFGLVVAVVFIGFVSLRVYPAIRTGVVVLLVVLGVGWITAVTPQTAQQQLQTGLDHFLDLTGGDELTGRLEIWSRAWWGVQDFSFTGMGMNNFRRVGAQLYPYRTIQPGQEIAHAHNDWLQVALDLGVLGLLAYLAIWLGLTAVLWQAWHIAPSGELQWLALGLAASLLAYLVYGLTDTVALGAKPGFIFWLLAGLSVGTYQQARLRGIP